MADSNISPAISRKVHPLRSSSQRLESPVPSEGLCRSAACVVTETQP